MGIRSKWRVSSGDGEDVENIPWAGRTEVVTGVNCRASSTVSCLVTARF